MNRNVMCNPNPYQSEVHAEVYEWAKKISDHLDPRTRAYHEIWLDGEKVADSRRRTWRNEPIYGPVYLPRKFKIGIAVPPSNDVDVFSQDLGFIAIHENGKLLGFNVAVGGGMGMTHGDPNTYPQLAQGHRVLPSRSRSSTWRKKSSRSSAITATARCASTPASNIRSTTAASTGSTNELDTPPRLEAGGSAAVSLRA